MKIVLIGAGSAQFGCGTLGDIFQSSILEGAQVTLLDINKVALDKVFSVGTKFLKENNLHYNLAATTNRAEALKDANFVIISIEVGDRFQLWDMDWNIPHQYGVPQVYGENGGPGGLFHALRIIPPILEICGDVMKICPDAFVFCYSNPMTAITTTVKRKFPALNFIGMCHEIASLSRYLPTILKTPKENIFFRAAGLNHFSVMVEAKYRDTGKDAYADAMQKAPAFFEKEPGYSAILKYVTKTGQMIETEGTMDRWLVDEKVDVMPWSDRTLFKFIMERFHLFPITGDSHLGEYISWAHDVADHKGILDFYTYYRNALAQSNRMEIKKELHERVVPIMEGIICDSGYEEGAVNILNDGFIPDLPSSIAVEVPAVISKKGIKGIAFPQYPKGFGALLRNYTGVYDLTAEAVLSGSKDLVIQAMLVSPVVHSCKNIPELADVMLERQSQWLSYIK